MRNEDAKAQEAHCWSLPPNRSVVCLGQELCPCSRAAPALMHCLSYVQAHHCLTCCVAFLAWPQPFRIATDLPDDDRTPGWPQLPYLLCPPYFGAVETCFISKDSSALLMPSAEQFSLAAPWQREQPAPTITSLLMQDKSCLWRRECSDVPSWQE